MTNSYYMAGIPFSDELYHHGIKGQKWGVRRFQYKDKSLTPAGRIRYNVGLTKKIIDNLDAGSTVYRTSVDSNDASKTGKVYVSATDVDRKHYMQGYWLAEQSGNQNADVYETKYVLKRKPKIADYNTVRDIFEEQRKQNPEFDDVSVDKVMEVFGNKKLFDDAKKTSRCSY